MFYTTNYKTKSDLFSGKLPYQLTNDYLFRAVFQTRPKALEGLCRAILRLRPEDTLSVTLQNPIELGTRIDNKEFILDLAVIINNIRVNCNKLRVNCSKLRVNCNKLRVNCSRQLKP